MNKLDVYLHNDHIGQLSQTRFGAFFQYDKGLKQNTPLLSTSLLVKDAKYKEGLTGNWFSGLLPEGERLVLLSRIFNCREDDYFTMLSNVGYECAGAVQIVPEGKSCFADSEFKLINEDKLLEIFNDNIIMNSANEFLRISIGGFQDKLCVTYKDNTIYLPNTGAISTHILKPERLDYPGLVESEAWATSVAGYVTPASKVDIIKVKDLPVLKIIRYDRNKGKRIHQEDFCQALGINTLNKYADYIQEKGTDPTYRKFVNVLMAYSEDPVFEIKVLAKQMIVNYLLGNYDAHAKNYSIVHNSNHSVSMSPMYDVVPIAEVEPRTKYLSLRINHKIKPEEIFLEDIIFEIQSWGIPNKIAKSIINECCEKILDGISAFSNIYPFASYKHAENVIQRINNL